jgi:hypothetical protein
MAVCLHRLEAVMWGTCRSCIYWKHRAETGSNDNVRNCMRHAPVVVPDKKTATGVATVWPRTGALDGCGEHEINYQAH